MPAILPHPIATMLHDGQLIPAHPLALHDDGTLDEQRQRALSRYYLAAGAGGLAVAVHTTQFGIRLAGLLEPVLRLAAEEAASAARPVILIAGVSGPGEQAVAEAELAAGYGYHLAMVILRGLDDLSEDELVDHIAAIGEVIPVFGFYLQPDVGGRHLGPDFWARLARLPCVAAIKIAPFSRYYTQDVVRAVCESPRADRIALYTGNDDAILHDLLTPFTYRVDGRLVTKRITGALIGQAAVWTHTAVQLLQQAHAAVRAGRVPTELLTVASQWTDANAALFDPVHRFAGSIAGVHEVLRRQGLLANLRLLDPCEGLSEGQAAQIDRVTAAYPHLQDDTFVAAQLDQWLRNSR
ncbi:dihydrodipicolinate synthase family protein [Dactylosporangium sp. CA-233914]|uniref:dihydrodipicolinate synthase family protein n=1 Tax=Dactylosporangium sp. CA-233914 TaxID=3239934 RepID=UPI003D90516C